MARRKRISNSVTRAETRAAALESIAPDLDLGHGLTLINYRKSITDANDTLSDYNTKLSHLDAALNALEVAEEDLDDLTARMLAGVAVKFGRDSDEYEQAGGTRQSERRRNSRAESPAPVPVPTP